MRRIELSEHAGELRRLRTQRERVGAHCRQVRQRQLLSVTSASTYRGTQVDRVERRALGLVWPNKIAVNVAHGVELLEMSESVQECGELEVAVRAHGSGRQEVVLVGLLA